MNRLTGYRSAAALVQQVLLALHPAEGDGLEDVPFPLRAMPASSASARSRAGGATEACDGVLAEWFRPGDEPLDPCPAHVRLAVDTRTGRPATPKTPRRFVELRTFVDLLPRYASWAAAAGLPRPPEPETSAGLARLLAADIVRLSIRSPEDGLRVPRDPETPLERSTRAPRGCPPRMSPAMRVGAAAKTPGPA